MTRFYCRQIDKIIDLVQERDENDPDSILQ